MQTGSSAFPDASRRLLIVDDHPLVRDSLHSLLRSIDPKCNTEHVLSMGHMQTVLRPGHGFTHVVLDLGLPDANGVDVILAARKCDAELPIIVFTARTEQDLILRSLSMGVLGYIPKTLYNDVVANAFRTVLAGQIYVPRQAVADMRQMRYGPTNPARITTSDPRELGLTERQIDVLMLILQGLPNKLICRRLDLAEGTVKVHVSAVLRALGVRNRTQAVIAASTIGLRLDENRLPA